MFKQKQPLPIKGVIPLILVSFLYDIAYTLLSPIYPIFVSTFLSKDAYVGYFASGFALLMMIYGFVVVKILEKVKKITLLKISLIGFSLSLISLTFVKNIYALIFVELFRAFFLTAVIVPTALLIREIANKKNLGKTEGLYFTATNLAWMIGPLIGGLLAKTYSNNNLFLLAALFPIISFIVVSYSKFHEHNHIHPKEETNMLANFKEFAKHRSLIVICLSTIFLLFWWSMVYTFIPLFIKSSGLSVSVIGWVLFLVVLPLILLEVPAGHFADKLGFKKFFIGGFVVMGLMGVSTAFVHSTNLVLTLIVLGSVGAAFVEPLREAYFFEKVKRSEEMRFYPIYRMALPLGQLIGPILFSTVLLFTNFRFLFVFIGCLMFVAAFFAMFLKDIKK